MTDFCGEKDLLKPPSGDHDYSLAQEKAEEVHSQLVAAKREIERLQKEPERAKSLSRFELLRYSYNKEMINFYTGFLSWKLLEMFISLVKPCADKIKTWSQEQRNRVKPNKGIPVALNHDTNYAFVSTL